MTPSAFLCALFCGYPADSGLTVEVRRIRPGRKGGGPSDWFPTSEQGLGRASAATTTDPACREWDCYFGVAPRRPGGRSDADCPLAGCLFIDVDGGEGGAQAAKDLIKMRVKEDPLLKPHFAVMSGGGVHAYYLLDAPFDTGDAAGRVAWSNMGKRLCRLLNEKRRVTLLSTAKADEQATNVSRMGRLPGAWNNKPDRQVKVELWSADLTTERHPFTWWDRNLDRLPEIARKDSGFVPSPGDTLPSWLYEWMSQPLAQGDMNRQFVAKAAYLARDLRLPKDVIRFVLETKASICNPRPSDRRIAEIVRWA